MYKKVLVKVRLTIGKKEHIILEETFIERFNFHERNKLELEIHDNEKLHLFQW